LSKDLIDREAMSLLCGFTGGPKEVSPVGVSRPKILRSGVERFSGEAERCLANIDGPRDDALSL
jgi:hypothetical protein